MHMSMAALFTIAKIWNQAKCPLMVDWIKKMWYMYTKEHWAATKECNQVLFRDIDGAGDYYS